MSAFMIDRQDYLNFAVQLHRFCNAPMPPHYTLELLRTLWWMPPADTTSTWAWRVDRLVQLMMLPTGGRSGIAISCGVSESTKNHASTTRTS